ncbi:hypothetical protein OG21DRAFT_1527911, partial [Imleria badia]
DDTQALIVNQVEHVTPITVLQKGPPLCSCGTEGTALCRLGLAVTRTETVRILEQLGVSIALEDPDGNASATASILRCRTNEIVDGATGAVVQKHVRFRVEFSVGSTQVGEFAAPTAGAGSSTSTGTSVTVSPRHASAFGKQAMAVGYACAIVLVQEKGSLSTFRAVCRWLREEWTLDALQSPPGGGSGGQGVFFWSSSSSIR